MTIYLRSALYMIGTAVAVALLSLFFVNLILDIPEAPPSRVPTTTLPEAQSAIPVPMTDAGTPSPNCTEDEERVEYSESVAICLHREGDGWRVIES